MNFLKRAWRVVAPLAIVLGLAGSLIAAGQGLEMARNAATKADGVADELASYRAQETTRDDSLRNHIDMRFDAVNARLDVLLQSGGGP